MGGKKKYINIFGSFTEPFNYSTEMKHECSATSNRNRSTTNYQDAGSMQLELGLRQFYQTNLHSVL